MRKNFSSPFNETEDTEPPPRSGSEGFYFLSSTWIVYFRDVSTCEDSK